MVNKIDEISKRLSKDMLPAVDITLIRILRQKSMFPRTEEDFYGCLEILDSEPVTVDIILNYSSKIYNNITEYYKNENKDILLILDYLNPLYKGGQ